jgi:hypothetical protein
VSLYLEADASNVEVPKTQTACFNEAGVATDIVQPDEPSASLTMVIALSVTSSSN